MRGTRKSIWHDAKEELRGDGVVVLRQVIVRCLYDRKLRLTHYNRVCMENIDDWCAFARQTGTEKWCYEIDLENL